MDKEAATRTTSEVAKDHISAVLGGDPKQMAADYAANAILERGDMAYDGIHQIQAYFQTVPARLGDAEILFDKLTVEGEQAVFHWRLLGNSLEVSGKDVLTIRNGEITHQVVLLNAEDF
tara:strand:- start:68 stop:424 length:357 start_codon:yes stop_codon:yes gene_type:complete